MRKSLALAVLLVAVRAAPWVLWEQAHFDSDQAIGGLMAKHLSELRAFPLVHYGQYYMLGVDTWLAAPLFRLFGPSVTMLKLPLVAINIAVVVLLMTILRRDAGLTPVSALLASLFVAIPPPVTASRLVEAQASNVEVFLYALLLWITRNRPWLFGSIAGFGIMHREFTIYPIVAMAAVAAWQGSLTLRTAIRAAQSAAAVMIAIELLKTRADLVGPGSAGTLLRNILAAHFDQSVASRLCWNPRALIPNLQWLVTDNLGTLFGWRVGPLSEFNLTTRVVGGHPIAAVGVALTVLCSAKALAERRDAHSAKVLRSAKAVAERHSFPIYLIVVGVQAILVYVIFGCVVRDEMLVRYTLLGLFIPVGAAALLFQSDRSRWVSTVGAVAIVVWAAAAATDDVRVLVEYVQSPPRNDYREFASFLESQGVRYGMAPFWTAYHIDFLSRERVILATPERAQIAEYQDLVRQHDRDAVRILFDQPCRGSNAIAFRRWCVER
jgi:hypothetical protein